MTNNLKFTGIAGSLRQGSYSGAILNSIASMLPENAQFETLNIGDFPHYNADLEQGDTLPEIVTAARATIHSSDAIIIVTPEYNHGIPGVLKNTLDWLSRPAFNSCFLNKPVLFATLSPGALGGVRAQSQMRETLASMLCDLVPLQEIVVTQVGQKVADGALIDKETITHIRSVLSGFLLNLTY